MSETPNTQEIYLPGEELEGGTAVLTQWLVAAGESVVEDQAIAELETDKVTLELAAPGTGVLSAIYVEAGAEVDCQTLLGRISEATNPLATSPAVRKLLREYRLDPAQITGSGRGARVTRNDVLAFLDLKSPSIKKPLSPKLPSRLVPHTPMRKRIAENMVASLLHTAPHVSSVWQMDMTNVMAHRKWHQKEFREANVPLTYTAYFLAAAATALLAVPETNARFHPDALELFTDINIGVGTALGDKGLVVPVVPSVQDKSLLEIARVLSDQTRRARAGELKPADTKGGTFTLSNHGVSGSLIATPIIIHQPRVAILGVGKLEKRVVVVQENNQDRIEIRPMCYVSLSIDHRALDAHQTNQWLAVFTQCIELWGE